MLDRMVNAQAWCYESQRNAMSRFEAQQSVKASGVGSF